MIIMSVVSLFRKPSSAIDYWLIKEIVGFEPEEG
jgi:hypothetical protein